MKRMGFIFVLISLLLCGTSGFSAEFYDPESYSFVQEGSDVGLVLLDDLGDRVLAAAKNDWGAAKASQAFDLVNGKRLYSDMPSGLVNNMILVQWSIFGENQVGKASVPDGGTAGKYSDLLCDKKAVGLNKDGIWSFYENSAFGKDTEDFERKELDFKSGNIETAFGDGELLWERNTDGVSMNSDSKNEIVIAFKAPGEGNYKLNMNIAGDAFFRITKCRDGYIFDGEFIKAFEVNSEKNFEIDIELSEGDIIFFHMMPGDYKCAADIELCLGEKVYSLYEDMNIYENKFWLSDFDGENYSAYDIDKGEITYTADSEILYLKPVFYIDKKYFKENRLDIKRTGKAVLAMIRNSFKKSELGIYSDNETDAIFNQNSDSFTFEERKVTDKDGNKPELSGGTDVCSSIQIDNNTGDKKEILYLMSAYKDGRLLWIECSGGVVGAYSNAELLLEPKLSGEEELIKIFLWDEELTPLSEISGEHKKLSLESSDDIGEFEFYKSSSGDMNFDNWTPALVSDNGQISVNSGFSSAMFWQDGIVRINIQNDSASPDKKGELKAVWTAPYNGNWKLSFNYKNIGTDVFGGDGGALRLDCLRADGSVYKIRDISVPLSFKGDTDWLYAEDLIELGAGDRIVLSVNAGLDGFGDKWDLKYAIEESADEGRDIFKNQELNDLPDTGIRTGKTGVPVRDNMVWLAMDPTIGDTAAGRNIVDYFNSYIPDMGVIYSTSKPEQHCVGQDYFKDKSIPLMAQNFGQQYVNYFDSQHAFEYTLDDTYLSAGNHPHFLAGSGHAVGMPHYAFTEAFGRFIKASADNGFSAAGYCDYVWAYCEAMGSCRNPETKKAFVEDLTGRDSGLRIKDKDNVVLYDFWDYYKYYFGDPKITPEMLGISTWEEYEPVTHEEYDALSGNADRHLGIQDLLVHYEFLKAAQFLSDTAIDEGIEFQIMPNPEWTPDGNDFLFLNKLDGLGMVTNEYFSSPVIIDGAYQRYEYLDGSGESSWGAVMEAGGGGNGSGYYTPEIAYLLSYEIGACGAEHMECDFLFNTSIESLKDSSAAQGRDTQLLSYGMGYSAAVEDGLSRRKADFIVVSDRQIVRPLMNKYIWIWEPWDLWLRQDLSVDFQLYKMGYRFDSISQEGIKEINEPQKLLVYSADVMTKEGFDKFLEGIESGYFENGILSAHSLKYTNEEKTASIVNSSLMPEELEISCPEFSYEERAASVKEGVLVDSAMRQISGGKVSMSGKTYRNKSGDEIILRLKTDSGSVNPAVVRRRLGDGTIYILLFDPSIDENYELSRVIYEYILKDMDIERQWVSVADEGSYKPGYSAELDENGRPLQQTSVTDEYGAAVRIYEKDELTVAGVQNSFARHVAAFEGHDGGMVPYEINGHTEVKVKMKPDTEYSYFAFPSGIFGSAAADKDGYLTLSFDDTSHELFYIVPKGAEEKLRKFRDRIDIWNEAITFGGRVDRIDY